jgi:hypothetical protein
VGPGGYSSHYTMDCVAKSIGTEMGASRDGRVWVLLKYFSSRVALQDGLFYK